MKPPENQQNPHLDDCRRLLTSLSDSIPAARSFRGRWTAVSATLHRLRAAVNDLACLPVNNDLADEFLLLLSHTLTLTLSLSHQCRSPDPPAGRLRTQSDLAAAAQSLHQQAADGEFLIRDKSALDPLPPQRASRLDALRADARALVARLQIGTPASRIPALDSLIAMIDGDDDKKLLIAVAQGLLPALLRLLDCASLSQSEAREKAVAAISRISSVESCRHLVIADGALLVTHLSRVLVEPERGGSSKEKACSALQVLTLQKDIAMTVGSSPTISTILEICRSGTPLAAAAAAGVLKNLSALPDLRQNIVDENCIPVMIRILRSGTDLAQENAAHCLSNLAADDPNPNPNTKLAILQEGVLDCIRNYGETYDAHNRDLEPAIRLLRNLSSSTYFAEIILSKGFLSLMILALDRPSPATRIEAANAISALAAACTKMRKEAFDSAVPGLVNMLEAKGVDEKDASAKSLASLMAFTACRRQMRKNEKGILSVIALLDPSTSDLQKKYSVCVLLAVCQTRRCRNLAVAAGARGYLPCLETMNVEGAKKLSELLSKGKLLGVFPRS